MKKYLYIVAIVLMFPLMSSAQTVDGAVDLQILIKQLQAQIQLLQTQVANLQTEVQSVKAELKFSRALAQGATGDDVKQLQEFLKNFTGAYPDGLVTGYYGPLTASAVKKFQAQNGIESVGVVGPKTQEKLNVLVAAIPATPTATTATVQSDGQSQVTTAPVPTTPSAVPYSGTEVRTLTIYRPVTTTPNTPCKTPTSVQPQYSPTIIKVLSPNGGEQWQMGEFQTVKYSVENLGGNKALLIYLEKGHDEPTTKTTPNSSQLIGVTTNLESYTYKLNQVLPAGNNYKITVYAEGSYSSCDTISYIGDSSDETFSIVPGQSPAMTTVRTFPTTSTTGGGYGQVQPSGLNNPANATPTNIVGNGYLTTEQKMSNIQAEINKLQNQLDTSNDTIAQAYLPSQIIALKGQLQRLPLSAQIDVLNTKLEKATDDETKTSLRSQIDALKAQVEAILSQTQLKPIYAVPPPAVAWTTQEKIADTQAQITAYQNKLDNTTDASARDNLMTQIITLKKIIQELQILPATTRPSSTTSTTDGGGYQAQTSGEYYQAQYQTQYQAQQGVQISPVITLPAVPITSTIMTTEEKIANIQAQIGAYQNKLNNTTDASARDSLTAQITALKKIIQELQNQIYQGQLLPITTPTPVITPVPIPAPYIGTTTSQAIPGIIHEPSVIVLSPNGGETLTTGKIYDIKWTGGNDTVDVYLLDNLTRLGKKIFSGIKNNKYISWAATPLSSSDLLNSISNTYATPSGQYVIFVGCADNNCTVDDSDSYFKIVE